MRKAIYAAAVGTIAAAGLVIASTPAQAATSVINTNCDAPITVYGLPGDTIVFQMGAGCQSDVAPDYEYLYIWNLNGPNPGQASNSGFLGFDTMTNEEDADTCDSYCSSTPGDWYTSTYAPSATLTTHLLLHDGAGHPLQVGATISTIEKYYADIYYAITWGGQFAPEEGTPIPDVIQQVGLPGSGSCDAVDDEALNWAGVKGGGWEKSWAEWVDNGQGGAVCTRTLHYDDGWTVAA